MPEDNVTSQQNSETEAARATAKQLIGSVELFLKQHDKIPTVMAASLNQKLGVLKHVIESANVVATRTAADQLRGAFEMAAEANANVSGGGAPPLPPPPSGSGPPTDGDDPPEDETPEPEPEQGFWTQCKNFFRWSLIYFRDRDRPEWRVHYAKMGVFSSRVYALLTFAIVPLIAWVNLYDIDKLWFTLGWCVVSTKLYLWYQGKAITTQQEITPEKANRDILNSVWPAIAVVGLAFIWVTALILGRSISFTEFGWIIMVDTIGTTIYDLKINNKAALMLSQAFPRIRETEEQVQRPRAH